MRKSPKKQMQKDKEITQSHLKKIRKHFREFEKERQKTDRLFYGLILCRPPRI